MHDYYLQFIDLNSNNPICLEHQARQVNKHVIYLEQTSTRSITLILLENTPF